MTVFFHLTKLLFLRFLLNVVCINTSLILWLKILYCIDVQIDQIYLCIHQLIDIPADSTTCLLWMLLLLTFIKGWWSGLSVRLPAWQGWGPEFKYQYWKKKKREHSLTVFYLHTYFQHIPRSRTAEQYDNCIFNFWRKHKIISINIFSSEKWKWHNIIFKSCHYHE
jgi:hypothetical protein